MVHTLLKYLLSFVFVIFLAGCVHQELVPPDQTSNLTQEESSSSEGSSVDISDLKSTTPSSEPTTPTPKPPAPVNRMIKRVSFPSAEYAKLKKRGNATVKGRIFVIAPSGKRVFGKSTRLYLNPVTSYSRQWYQESYLGGKKLSRADSRLYSYLKFTTSDARGDFTFYGVPSGRYYLIGIVKCKDECGYSTMTNIRIAKEVDVSAGSTLEVDLSKRL